MEGVFVSRHPLVQHKLTLLRDKRTNATQFRQIVRELAILLCYEATQDLALSAKTVKTPMGTAQGAELREAIGLVPILRAGLGMVDGVWEMMPSAEVWHIGLYRDENTRPSLPDTRPDARNGRVCRSDGHPTQGLGRTADQVCGADCCARRDPGDAAGASGRTDPHCRD